MSDIIGSLGLSFFPIVAMLIFIAVFLAVMHRLLWRRRDEEFIEASRLPLDDGPRDGARP